MKMLKSIKRFIEEAKLTDGYWVEKAKLDFSTALEQRRRASGMSYKDVADKIGVSQPYVSKVFRGDSNVTIESMVKLARATGSQLDIRLIDTSVAASVHFWKDSSRLRVGPRRTVSGASETVVSADLPAANTHNWLAPCERLAA
ncbi:helix-turn-helix transcriptional regulator [uncultured Xylophilus sp.]|uniref:helix-turn-helix domain-containing protein n=1 Tax=uncultured Xylophilus sp. TaxID=296832 RepID=UPI0025F44BB4|nr:helix-turn-helix transcriptional regulator [uncultured Xylophilus sp.]